MSDNLDKELDEITSRFSRTAAGRFVLGLSFEPVKKRCNTQNIITIRIMNYIYYHPLRF